MSPMLSLLASKFLFVAAALLPIINPPGLVPFFISLTAHNTPAQRAFLARRIAIYCFLLLLGSMYIGGFVLSFFGVSLPVVQLSGGLLITFAAWRMLNDNPAENTPDVNQLENREALKQRAFYPLTFPMTVGPGSISVAITVGASLTSTGKALVKFTVAPLAAVAAVAVTCLLIWWCLLHADKFMRYLGQTGAVVFLRLTAFILLCLGVQIMWEGFSGLVEPLLQGIGK
ncbi:MarC family protein [Vogesella oryzae]|uniref:MarC family protein n=1 Tax=Vogesella oryzae TaxID=1735285 RepID=UPI001FE8C966|nr:MarC family protein [Vogesella oryzae]